MDALKCLHCGFCCKRSPCAFAKWENNHCLYLKQIDDKYYCDAYDEIKTKPFAHFNPAFDQGCCSSMNKDRMKLAGYKEEGKYLKDILFPL
jgi:hypothetical protein